MTTWLPLVCLAGSVVMFFASLHVYAETLRARDDARSERIRAETAGLRRSSIRRVS